MNNRTKPQGLLKVSAAVLAAGAVLWQSSTQNAVARDDVKADPASQVSLNVAMAKPVMKAGKKQIAHMKVGLTGFDIKKKDRRTPVNVCLVLDKSGSMQGLKMRQSIDAAKLAIGMLDNEDIVSIVTYDSVVNVLVPATKITDKQAIYSQLEKISANGSTALFGGVSKGATEIRKFLDKNRANRIILLSDGKANSGPSSPADLADLGGSLIKEGISVTTIGLGQGYNEDLMAQLAESSDGHHAFVEEPRDLAKIFESEFDSVLSVVAQRVSIKIQCEPGIKPVRILGQRGTISGNTISLSLNHLFAKEEKYAIVELEMPPTSSGTTRSVGSVEVSYSNMSTKGMDKLHATTEVKFDSSDEKVQSSVNKDVMVAAATQIATDNSERAIKLRDAGKVAEAKALMVQNMSTCMDLGKKLNSPELTQLGVFNGIDAKNVEAPQAWAAQRKVIVEQNSYFRNDQRADNNLLNTRSRLNDYKVPSANPAPKAAPSPVPPAPPVAPPKDPKPASSQ